MYCKRFFLLHKNRHFVIAPASASSSASVSSSRTDSAVTVWLSCDCELDCAEFASRVGPGPELVEPVVGGDAVPAPPCPAQPSSVPAAAAEFRESEWPTGVEVEWRCGGPGVPSA